MTCGGAGPAGNDAPSDATRFRGRAAVTGGRFDGATGWLRAGHLDLSGRAQIKAMRRVKRGD